VSAETHCLTARPPAAATDSGTVDLSVVVVTFDSENDVSACLESLRSCVASLRTEVIVVDNGSSDGTWAALEPWRAEDGRSAPFFVRALRNAENLGYTRAMNQALQQARGSYVLFLNPDTRIEPGALQALADYLDAHPEVGVVAPHLRNPDGSVQPSCRRFPRRRDLLIEMTGLPRLFPQWRSVNRWKMGDFDHQALRQVDQPQGACLLTRAEVLNSVGLLDERFPMFFSDVDWCRRVWQAGWKIVFYPDAKVVHRKGASVYRNRAAMIWSSHRSFYDYWQKYASRGVTDRILNTILGAALWVTAVIRAAAAVVFARERWE
jgi:GT2 family glycosyltransferase